MAYAPRPRTHQPKPFKGADYQTIGQDDRHGDKNGQIKIRMQYIPAQNDL
jgi:hypothetical protein